MSRAKRGWPPWQVRGPTSWIRRINWAQARRTRRRSAVEELRRATPAAGIFEILSNFTGEPLLAGLPPKYQQRQQQEDRGRWKSLFGRKQKGDG